MIKLLKSLFSGSENSSDNHASDSKQQKDFDVLKYDGIRAQRIGRIDYAIRCYEEALKITEDFETMNHLMGAYITTHALEEALQIADRMYTLEPESIPTLLSRANLYFMLEDATSCIRDCEEILKTEEQNEIACYMMGKAKKSQENHLEAIADLTKAISIKEDFAAAYLLRAEILVSVNQFSEAFTDIEKVKELAPEEEISYLLAGKIHQTKGEFEQAGEEYQQVLDLNPFHEEAGLLMGSLLIDQEKWDEAINLFDELIESKPDFAKAYSERGRAKNSKGDKEGAFEDLKKSIELNPEGEEAQKMNGQHTNFNNMYQGGIY